MDFVHQLLSGVGLGADDVDVVLLVGGSTFMPMIRNAVEGLFPGKVRIEQPNLAVAKGAALSAAIEWNERIVDIKEKLQQGKDISQEEQEVIADIPDEVISSGDASDLLINVPQQVSTVSDKLTRSLGPAVFVSEDSYMIDNLLFVDDEIPAEAESVYGTRVDNAPEIVVNVYENVATDRVNKHVLPCFDQEGNEQYPDPELKVKRIGEVRLQLPPNTPKGSPIRVVFRSSTVGLEVTAENMETGEAATVEFNPDNGYTAEQVTEAKKRFEGINTSGQI